MGEGTSWGDLIQVTGNGTAVFPDPSQGPYGGDDDTLVEVIKDSSEPGPAIEIPSDTDAFGPTWYEDPNTSFTDTPTWSMQPGQRMRSSSAALLNPPTWYRPTCSRPGIAPTSKEDGIIFL